MTHVEAYHTALEISRSPIYLKKNFRYPKSFTFQYAFYRIARPFLKLNYKIFKHLHPIRPWTTQASIKIFESILRKDMIGFEYGSGNSTVFFAKRIKHLTSVEHDSGWHTIVQNIFKEQNINNVDYIILPPEDTKHNKETYSFYTDFDLNKNSFQIMKHYHDYFSFVKKFPDHHFDFIMVDGRARVECTLNALPKLKPGGIFVLDNSDRARYKPIFDVLSKWPSITTTTGLFDTTIWFKPEH